MNTKALFIWICLTINGIAPSLNAQGNFINLDFEMANPVAAGSPYPSFYVTTASALPGWAVYYGATQEGQIPYNAISTGATQVALLNSANGAIGGNYSVLLQGGGAPQAPPSISQTGLIPANTQSLQFEAEPGFFPLNLLVGGQLVPFNAIGSGLNYTLYGANISAWAGQTEQIMFSATAPGGINNWELDNISFSQIAVVPEPSLILLTGIGGLIFATRKYFTR